MGSHVLSTCIALIILASLYDCFNFVPSAYKHHVYANRSGEALFRWKYSIGNAEPKTLRIKCFYYNGGNTKRKVIAQKIGHDSSMLSVASLPDNSNVEGYTENLINGGVDRSVIGFKIMRAQLYQPTQYRCEAIFSDRNTQQLDSELSVEKQLVVLDPPKLLNCLDNLKPVKEEDNLEISCYATGNPPPTLECKLYSNHGSVLAKIPEQEAALVSNISLQVFPNIDRSAEFIMCYAYGGEHTGHANVTKNVTVLHTPSALGWVEVVGGYNHSSLSIKWAKPPENETGGDILGYKIDFYSTASGRVAAETVIIPIDKLQVIEEYGYTFYLYTLWGLTETDEYVVQVYAYNSHGDGHKPLQPIKQIPALVPLRSTEGGNAGNIGLIVGAVIAVIVFVVIIIVLLVWCLSRNKKQKQFPTSHVEDAVDYPPNVGASLYASVDKKKNPRAGAGDYPDVVNDTSEMMPLSSNSYEPSSKAFV